MSRASPILDQVNIVSGDMEASMAFYRRLGIAVPEQAIWRTASGAHHANMQSGQFGLDLDSTTFAQIWNTGWHGRGDLKGRVVLGFRLASRAAVDETYADLTGAGYAGLQAPYDAFWGARFAVVEDPDGLAVGLMSAISPDMKSTPPDL
jgi:uncharacterized glyoxalase superfamily protein PhnB